ncbi:uncharacterized protein [Panulirus ornatus]|uniref:uncharacterized protein n=1 Tax=Panulirus ornatus TaxID=150431 RepID=UPI003A8B6AF9
MADVQDDDQWLYGDEKDESKEEGEINDKTTNETQKTAQEDEQNKGTPMEEGEGEAEKDKEGEDKGEKDKEGDKEDGEKGDEDSSDDDDLTITIGAIKTQPDIIQAPTHSARFQPKAAPTTGLKDEDFTSPGKVNGVPITEFNIADLEDKPWRKPGADISDYFNYGFNEETWFKYCERQKRMRISESGAGLTGLGISVTKKYLAPTNFIISFICVSFHYFARFGGNPYGDAYYPGDPAFYGGPAFENPPPWGPGGQPPLNQNNWEGPGGGPPNVTPVSSGPSYFDEDSVGASSTPAEPEEERHRSRRSHRSRSRSPSRHRHSSRHARSRSRSPSHRHKRKKSKRERDAD